MPVDPDLLVVFLTMLAALFASLIYAAWYQQFKHRHKQGKRSAADTAGSIGLSELEGVIRKAVAEATEPLDDRMATLEDEFRALRTRLSNEQRRLAAPQESASRVELPEEEAEDDALVRARRRVR